MANRQTAEEMIEAMEIDQESKDIALMELAQDRGSVLEILKKYASKDESGKFFRLVMRSEPFAQLTNRWQWEEHECPDYLSESLPLFALKSFGHALIRWQP